MPEKAILCVDDERIILSSLRTQLCDSLGDNYSFEFAESADEALEVIEELEEDNVEIALIISDWLMPGTKGDEFLIRVHKKHPHSGKILLTGQADEAAVMRAKLNANLHLVLAKPWSQAELLEALNGILE